MVALSLKAKGTCKDGICARENGLMSTHTPLASKLTEHPQLRVSVSVLHLLEQEPVIGSYARRDER